MVFSTPIFLFIFLPLLITLYFVSPRIIRNYVLLVFSLIFYTWGEGSFVLLMLTSIVVNHFVGLWISRAQRGKIALTVGLAINLGLLMYFKYFMFIANEITGSTTFSIYLPLGISFYTFQSMSYLIDIYRNPNLSKHRIDEMALYISFFPQLIAGPILKYNHIAAQLRNRESTLSNIYLGASRFIYGLGKKVIIANSLGKISSEIFAISTDMLTAEMAWLGAVCFTFQIYFDFSGYSDMAIGLGKIFGFDFPENFNLPYLSKSIKEFWRRWHMTLSSWFKDYLYIPLGGSKNGKAKTYRNLIIVFLLCGIWHGANWTFVVWGCIHGFFLVLERSVSFNKVPVVLRHFYTLFVVIISWIFFNSPSIGHALKYLSAMFGFGINDGTQYDALSYFNLETSLILILATVFALFSFKTIKLVNYTIINSVCIFLILLLSIMYLSGDTYNPFLYYKF